MVAPADTFITISGEINFGSSTYTLFVNGVPQKGNSNNTLMTFTTPITDLYFSMKQLTNTITDPGTGVASKGNATFSVDNVRMELVPEAASLGMLGAGAATLLLNRRK